MDGRATARAVGLAAAILLAAAPASAKVLKLRIDPANTQIVASVPQPFARLRGSVTGTFRVIAGEIAGDPADPVATAHVEIVIDATIYQSDSASRDRGILHDALESRFYQVIKFVSRRVENLQWDTPRASGSAVIVGDLTLHGVTREMRVPIGATLSVDGNFSADGDLQFDYTDFDITPPHELFGILRAGKIVDLNFRIIAVPLDVRAATSNRSPR
jgi:polyisoprenoid-binding protein YceI